MWHTIVNSACIWLETNLKNTPFEKWYIHMRMSEAVFRFSNPLWAMTVLGLLSKQLFADAMMGRDSSSDHRCFCLAFCHQIDDLDLATSISLCLNQARSTKKSIAMVIPSWFALVPWQSKKPYNRKPYTSRHFGHVWIEIKIFKTIKSWKWINSLWKAQVFCALGR